MLTVRVPKGMRRRLERRAKAQQDEPLEDLTAARAELIPQARAQDIYTDEDVFALLS